MPAITDLTIAELRDGLRAKQFSARETAAEYIAAVEAARVLNAYVHEMPEAALTMADAADSALSAGTAGPLAGVTLGIKDLFAVEGAPMTAGSRILEGFRPPYDATITANLRRDGAVFLGKLNMDEFAMGSSNETSAWGPVLSPWRKGGSNAALTPGGSSGGSAAAVSARIAAGATGTDTGGSIRQPAAFVGIVGFKPTYGRCSRWGVVAFASSLDQAGPMARTARDAAILATSMCGFDPKDSTSLDLPVPDFEAALTGDLRGKRIGLPREYRVDAMPPAIDALWERGAAMLRDAGAEVIDVSLPHTKYALPAYYIIAPAEASSNLARYDGVRFGRRAEVQPGASLADMYEATRAEGFGREVKRRVMIGTYVLSAGYYDAYYLQAQKVRALIARDFTAAFERCDYLLTPTAPSAAFALGDKSADPIAMYLNDVFTVPSSLAGLPAASIPAGLDDDGLPLGLQIIGPALDDAGVLNAAYALERAAGFRAAAERWW